MLKIQNLGLRKFFTPEPTIYIPSCNRFKQEKGDYPPLVPLPAAALRSREGIGEGAVISGPYFSMCNTPRRHVCYAQLEGEWGVFLIGLVYSVQGPKGGYVLARLPEEITFAEIVETMENSTSLLDCLDRPKPEIVYGHAPPGTSGNKPVPPTSSPQRQVILI